MKNFLAPRPDSFRPIIYLELTKELALPLLIIYKKSLLTGEVPNQWKHANVTAILKKGKKLQKIAIFSKLRFLGIFNNLRFLDRMTIFKKIFVLF